ncbi:MAG: aldo/keto reductase [Candidatus Obscuribacterales bacterium]|nr:aldo/keto reductase [Candidatus Obscuribacterales bacterium]
MEKRKYGNTDMTVSVLGFGGAEIGFQGASPKAVSELLNNALDAGLNVIDTAECYVNSEELIGEAIQGRRDQYYLFTKCGHSPESYEIGAWSKSEILDSVERSLKRLRTDRLDLVHLHSCDLEQLKNGEVIEALQEAKKAGKTRYIGYSGDGEAALYAIKCGAFDSLQTSVNIADQEAIDLTLPAARAANMGVIAKRPVANAAWKEKSFPDYYYIQEYWNRFQKLNYGFLNGDMQDAISKALRFTLSVPGVCTAIVGTTKAKRWQENAKLLEKGPLPEAEFEEIRKQWKEKSQPDWVGQI